LGRALTVSQRHMMIRELILQLKTGGIEVDYFRQKFGVDVFEDFADRIDQLVQEENLTVTNGRVKVTRQGLLQVDRLLPEFFDPEHRGTRYT